MGIWRSLYAHRAVRDLRRPFGKEKSALKRLQAGQALTLEPLEERMLMAIGAGPDLEEILPNDGAPLVTGDVRNVSPREFTLRFDATQIIDPASLGAIQVLRSGGDGFFAPSMALGTVTSGASTTIFSGSPTLSAADDFYNGKPIAFTSGALTGQVATVTDYVGASRTFTVAPAFTAIPAGGDAFQLNLNTAADMTIMPSIIPPIAPVYRAIGERANEVVLRFAERLPDDLYRVHIVGSGATPLENNDGQAFNGGADLDVDFRLDQGTQVVGVVPQPVFRVPGPTREIEYDNPEVGGSGLNQIEVYFDAGISQLVPGTGPGGVQRPEYYQLIFTNGTVTTADDVMVNPMTVHLPATAAGQTKVVLEFDPADLDRLDSVTSNTVAAGASASEFSGNAGLSDADDFYNGMLVTLAGETRSVIDYVGSTRTFTVAPAFSATPAANAPFRLDLTVGTYRLRIGDAAGALPAPLAPIAPPDAGSSFASAHDLFTLGPAARIVTGQTDDQDYGLTLPGGNTDPGHRDVPGVSHLATGTAGQPDTELGLAPIIYYDFRSDYGRDASGAMLTNQILLSPDQQQRVREIFDLYSHYLGVQFVETTPAPGVASPPGSITVAVGLLSAVNPAVPSGVGGPTGIAGNPNPAFPAFSQRLVVMDNADFSGAAINQFGAQFTRDTMQQIGSLLGFGVATDLPDLTVNGASPSLFDTLGTVVTGTSTTVFTGNAALSAVDDTYNGMRLTFTSGALSGQSATVADYVGATRTFTLATAVSATPAAGTSFRLEVPAERIFPGDADILHGQHLFRPESNDIDLYRFDVAAGQHGVFTAETTAERLRDALGASTLDTVLSLYGDVTILSLPAGNALNDGNTFTLSDGLHPAVTFEFNSFGGVALGNRAISFIPSTDTKEQIAAKVAEAIRTVAGLDVEPVVEGDQIRLLGASTLSVPPAIAHVLVQSTRRELLARNDDYYSEDSFVQLRLRPGTYYVGVTSTGNEFNPEVANSGFGGTTEGRYELRLEFRPDSTNHLVDALAASAVTNETLITATSFSGGPTLSAADDFYNGVAVTFTSGALAGQTRTVSDYVGSTGTFSFTTPFTAAPILGDTFHVAPVLLDGDGDGRPGGVFNFHFQASTATNTIYVDKIASNAGQLGTLSNPFNNFQAAVGAAIGTQGRDIIRIVANGGEPDPDGAGPLTGGDGLVSTTNDNITYELGFNSSGGALSDGASFRVPQGTMVMIDPGVIIKLRQANIEVGSTSTAVAGDRSLSHLQVLGIPGPGGEVLITSYHNEAIGKDVNPAITNPARGDWGGLVFRNDVDRIAGRRIMEEEGIFLNYVNHAGLSYGGGQLQVGVDPVTFNPIYMIESRPTVTNNSISLSADAALSADPNSFADTRFQGATFTADYDRVGPDIHGNLLTNNSFNAMFVRVETAPGQLRTLDTWARWDDTDVVHMLAENLMIRGRVGGSLDPDGPGILPVQARLDGRLSVDPGVVVKLQGSRIETQFGAQFLAEGTAEDPVLFVSLRDDSYGVGGTFDTNNDGSDTTAAQGNWGGLYFGYLSQASIDHARITHAGGETTIEGGFGRFNAVEAHRADVRIANSTLAVHAAGFSAADRNGRGSNDATVIFARGAQPVLINNRFHDNAPSAISIDVNSLHEAYQPDPGRSTGGVSAFDQFADNFGPLVRLNRMDRNFINGMVVRPGTLTTAGVWDDTDIVHVVLDTITVSNVHSTGGLRVQSSGSQSLVVKLFGQNAGFTITGRPLDIDDRIGGSVQLVGTPGHPVVLTSLGDDTVGAGLDLDGNPQNNTGNSGQTATSITGSLTLIQPDPFVGATLVGNIGMSTDGLGTLNTGQIQADVPAGSTVAFAFLHVATTAGGIGFRPPTIGFQGQVLPITWLPNVGDAAANFETGRVDVTSIVRSVVGSGGGIFNFTVDENVTGNPVSVDGTTLTVIYTNPGLPLRTALVLEGGLTGATPQTNTIRFSNPIDITDPQFTASMALGIEFSFQGVPVTQFSQIDINGQRLTTSAGHADDSAIAPTNGTLLTMGGIGDSPANPVNPTLNNSPDDELYTLTPLLTNGATQIQIATSNPSNDDSIFLAALLLSGNVSLGGVGEPGDWRSVQLQQFSNDRNVDTMVEREAVTHTATPANDTPGTAQLLGELAPNLLSGSDDRRLGFQAQGYLSSGDVDVYSFIGTAGQEVWLDIDRTTSGLDTILELTDETGAILARSNNSAGGLAGSDVYNVGGFITNAGLGNNLGRRLQRDAFSMASTSDLYTSNIHDAGMRVVLPFLNGAQDRYFIRIRSNSPDLSVLNGGRTTGAYQLQLRLQEADEFPGSTVNYSDIRFATNGIDVQGLPKHSPLLGDTSERTNDVGDETFNAAANLNIGNVLTTDRGALSVAGSLATTAPVGTDVDWYVFNLDHDLVLPVTGSRTWSTIFDIDYADGLSRPDTGIAVYAATGELLFIGRESDVVDDRDSAGTSPLSGGSTGLKDPFIGSVQLPVGTAAAPRQYLVAVFSNAQTPNALNATFTTASGNRTVRLEPVNSIQRIAEDHIGFSGYTSGQAAVGGTALVSPQTPSLFDISTALALETSVRPFTFSDAVLYVSTGSTLQTIDPATGAFETTVGTYIPGGNLTLRDLAFRSDGRLHAVDSAPGTPPSDPSNLVRLDVGNAARTLVGGDAIGLANDGLSALTYLRTGFAGGAPTYDLYYAAGDNAGGSRLFRANPATGSAAVAAPFGPVGTGIFFAVAGDRGVTTGMAFIGGTLYGISNTGRLFTISLATGRVVLDLADMPGTGFAGLSLGPQNLDFNGDGVGGDLARTLFAVTENGQMFAFDEFGAPAVLFDTDANNVPDSSVINTGVNIPAGELVTGLAFSTLDYNLWHPTLQRRADAGHGITTPFDGSRSPAANPQTINGRAVTEGEGGASFYFGLEGFQATPSTANGYFDYGTGAQYGIGTAAAHQDLVSTTGVVANTYNLPGGAYGSLVTSPFSLEGYGSGDKPTLYFNYYLRTENTNTSTLGQMRDSARVFASSDGGATWFMLATNNSSAVNNGLGTRDANGELPPFYSANSIIPGGDPTRQRVQELFETTVVGDNTWRQARVDLSEFAGLGSLLLRFDFSTAGTINQGLPGDEFGDINSNLRLQNNLFEGFYVDDILIGFAERGEMVTAAPIDQRGFVQPPIDPVAPPQTLIGQYQLEIRRGTEYATAVPVAGAAIRINPALLLDTNDRLVQAFTIQAVAGSGLLDGQTFQISDGVNLVTFEFNTSGGVQAGNAAINVTAADSATTVAGKIRDAINAHATLNVFASVIPTSNEIELFGAAEVLLNGTAQNVTVEIGPASITEGTAPTSVIVRRSGPTTADLTVTITTSDGGAEVSTPISLLIPAGQDFATFDLATVNDTDVEAIQAIEVRAAALGFNSITDVVDIIDNDLPALIIMLAATVSESGAAIMGTVARNSEDRSRPLTVTLVSSDASEASFGGLAIGTVTILAGDGDATFMLDPEDDFLLDNDQSVVITAYAAGFSSVTHALTVTDDVTDVGPGAEELSVSIAAATISESGAGATTSAIVTRTGSTAADLIVTLSSSNPGQATVTTTVTILAGSASSLPIEITVAGVVDAVADGTQTVVISPTAAGYESISDTVDVLDSDLPLLTLTIVPGSISEDAGIGAAMGTVTRNTPNDVDLQVTIYSHDRSEAVGPTTVVNGTVATGSSSTTFDGDPALSAVDDFYNGASVTFTSGALSGQTRAVTDYVGATRTFTVAAPFAATPTAGDSLRVDIYTFGTVTIPAGADFVNFRIDAVNELLDDGVQTAGFTASASGLPSARATLTVSGTNDLDLYSRRGDENLDRPQGQVVIANNFVMNSSQTGIRVNALEPRTLLGQPHPGAVRNLGVLNPTRITPGVTIENNVVAFSGQVGISFSGDVNTAPNPQSATQFGRIVNNTLYGGAVQTGIGIQVTEFASPTLLNNIVSNFVTGILIDATAVAAGTVLGGTVYKGNGTDASTGALGTGSFPDVMAAGDRLFRSPATKDFELLQGSRAIDSSINVVQERPELATIYAALGIQLTPVTAPQYDITGRLRVDNPFVNSPPGLGANVFKDRGAIERLDPIEVTVSDPFDSLIEDVVVLESAGNAVIAVRLSEPSPLGVTIQYTTANGTANAGPPENDYTATSGTLTFLAGQTVQLVSVPITNDSQDELDETFFLNIFNLVTIGNPNPIAQIIDPQGQITITDDDAPPSFSILDFAANEGDDDGIANLETPFVFTVQLSAASGKETRVQFVTRDGTALLANSDYVSATGTLTFLPGVTTQLLTVQVNADAVVEPDEMFFVDLFNPVAATIADGSATGTITDDEPIISVALTLPAPSEEGNSGTTPFVFTVTLNKTSPLPITFDFNTIPGTATSPADFAAAIGTTTIPAFALSTTITVQVVGDTFGEPNETFQLRLSNPTHPGPIIPAKFNALNTAIETLATATIIDDEPRITISDVTIDPEGDSGTQNVVFIVSLSRTPAVAAEVVVNTANGTAIDETGLPNNDYFEIDDLTLTFLNGGPTTQFVTVTVRGDTLDENDETFFVNLTNNGNTNSFIADPADAIGVGTIVDDDGLPTVSIGDVSMDEGDSGTTNFLFPVTLSVESGREVRVAFTTTPGSATAGVDFVPASGTLTFAPGQTSLNVLVQVAGDMTLEPDEVFSVNLSIPAPATATLLDGTAVGTIADDEGRVTITDVSLFEGDAGFTNFVFDVVLDKRDFTNNVVVNFATADGPGPNPARGSAPLQDYVPTSGALTFAPGVGGPTTKQITVQVIGELSDEFDETFVVNLTSEPFRLTDNQGLGTIRDDDGLPTLTINDTSVAEGDSSLANAVFDVVLSVPSGMQVTVVFATANGATNPANAGIDYNSATGTITFVPGQATHKITIQAIGDTIGELNETFFVNLSGAVNATIADSQGLGTIIDNEPRVTILPGSVQEGDFGSVQMEFVVQLSKPSDSGQTIQVVYSTEVGAGANPATPGVDYTAVANATLVFSPGQTVRSLFIPVLGDLLDEEDETFRVRLNSATGALVEASPLDNAEGTIVDNDALPIITIDDVTVTEGNTLTANAVFTVSLSAPSGRPVSVAFATANGTATAADYTTANGVLNFPLGIITQKITVAVTGDTSGEPDETFLVNLSTPTNAFVGDSQGVGTIDDDEVRIVISDVAVAESSSAVFLVSLVGTPTGNVTVAFTTADNTANSSDYTATAGTLTFTFALNETTKQLTVAINSDALGENNETFFVNLSSPSANAVIEDPQAVGTIVDDDTPPTVSIVDKSVTEGNAGTVNAVFTVQLSAPSGLEVRVPFSTADGTATLAGNDYNTAFGTVTFAPLTAVQFITVQVRGDTLGEPDESFLVNLGTPVNATLADGQAVGTIGDDEPRITITDPLAILEQDSGQQDLVFQVSLDRMYLQAVTVAFATSNGTATAPADYAAASGTVTFAINQTTQFITIAVQGDLLDENNETFVVNLSSPSANAVLADNNAVGTITDNDAMPSLTIGNVSVTEGNVGTVNALFPVTLSAASGLTVTVVYSTANGTLNPATAGSDYVAITGATLTFNPGETLRNISVTVNGDTAAEQNETFFVNLAGALNATISDNQGLGTIGDDEPRVSVSGVTVSEGDAGPVQAQFVIQLDRSSTQVVTVTYATDVGMGPALATAGTDYTAIANATVTFNPGETVKSVFVPVLGDVLDEDDETFSLRLTGATNAILLVDVAPGKITDNDPLPIMTINDVTVMEGNAGTTSAILTVLLSNPSGRQVTVAFATADGTATAADPDYAADSNILTFAVGETSKQITVQVLGDNRGEPQESFVVNLTSAVNATVPDPQGSVTISDDEPRISVLDSSFTEGNGGSQNMPVEVRLDRSYGQVVTVQYVTADGSASAPGDYTSTSGTLTFLAMQTVQIITVSVQGDSLDEANETFTVTLSSQSGNAIISDNVGQQTILDDDGSPAVSIEDMTVLEGNSGPVAAVFRVLLSQVSGQQVQVPFSTANGTATVAGNDYFAAGGVVTFAVNTTEQFITVQVRGDNLGEPNETFLVNLGTPLNATLGDGQGLGTIEDDEPRFSVNDVIVTETEATVNMIFTVSLNAAPFGNATVVFSTTPLTASAGADYTPTSGTLTFSGAATTQLVTVQIAGDSIDEADETLQFNLTSPSANVVIGDGQGLGTIIDNDGLPNLSIGDMSVIEGNSGTVNLVFPITLSSASGLVVSVQVNTGDGLVDPATAGMDYLAVVNQVVTFNPGETQKNVTVQVLGDRKGELNETLLVNLVNSSNAVIFDNQAVGTILDDEPIVSIDPVTVDEANGNVNAVFMVRMDRVSTQTVTVTYSTQNGTALAPGDYTAQSSSVSIPAGQLQAPVTVIVRGDLLDEPTETFSVVLGAVVPTDNANIGTGTALGTITDDDPTPSLAIGSPAAIPEGNNPLATTPLVFPVTLLAPSGQTVTVAFNTADGSAMTANNDYVSAGGILTFDPGDTQKLVTVQVRGDELAEPNETFLVQLQSPVNASVSAALGTGTITDDEPRASINDITVTETDADVSAVFTVSLVGSTSGNVVLTFSTVAGTAAAGADYVPVAGGTISFLPGESSKTVTVTVQGDLLDEDDESFFVNIASITSNVIVADPQGVATIVDNDPLPSVSIGDAEATEGTSVVFTLTLSAASGRGVTVNYATAAGTATANADFTTTSGSVSFAAGVTERTVTVQTVGDVAGEFDETFTVSLSTPAGATIGDGLAVGTIRDNDPRLRISDVTVTETNTGTVAAVFNVTLTSPSPTPITVLFSTAAGTALTGADFMATNGALTFAANTTLLPVTVQVQSDALNEDSETFFVNLANASTNTVIIDSQGQGTILDNDPLPSLSIGNSSVTEGDGGIVNAVFNVALSAPSGRTVTVDFATADGVVNPTTAGADYAPLTGVVTFAAGQTQAQIIVQVNGDLEPEPNETFFVNLAGASNATILDNQGLGTIGDDEPLLSISGVTVTELDSGSSNAVFTASISRTFSQPVTAVFATANGMVNPATAGTDYTATNGTLTIAAGSTTAQITVQVLGDLEDEVNETFFVNLSQQTNATLAAPQVLGTIRDNDAQISIANVTKIEADTGTVLAVFNVTLSRAKDLPVTVAFATSDVTATANVDYTPASGTLTFNIGQTLRTITVTVLGDFAAEGNETFNVTLSGAVNGVIPQPVAVGTIQDNDPPPQVFIDDTSVTEGGMAVFNIRLNAPSSQPVTVAYSTMDGVTNPATAGSDYVAVSGATLTFNPGETLKNISVTVNADTTAEQNETFFVNLTLPVNAMILDNQGTATILDNDQVITISDFSLPEGNAGTLSAVFTVTLSQNAPVNVRFDTANGTALAGFDYVATSGTLSFGIGETVKQFTVSVLGDLLHETNETFNVNLTLLAGSAGQFGDSSAIGTIGDDDAAPNLSIGSVTLPEGNPPGPKDFVFTAALSAPSGQIVTATFITANLTATAGTTPGSDYLATSGAITFMPGQITRQITVAVSGDTSVEGDETFTVTLANPSNAVITSPQGVGAGTIVNDDVRHVFVTGADAGGGPHVKVFDSITGLETLGFMAYDLAFSGGVRVAAGDVNGDAIPDIATTPGAGGGPHLRVFNGQTGQELYGLMAFEESFIKGVQVSMADVTGDGRPDIIVGTDGNPGDSLSRVRVFDGPTGALLRTINLDASTGLQTGVRVAAGDVNGDSRADLILSSSAGVNSQVQILDAMTGLPLEASFSPYPGFTGGVYVAAGDVNGDGTPDIITGAGAGGGPHVRIFSGLSSIIDLGGFMAYNPAFGGGVRVASTDYNADGRADIVTAAGPGGGPHIRVLSGTNLSELRAFFAYPNFTGGVNVGGSFREVGAALQASGGAVANGSAASITQADVLPLVQRAIADWAAAGLDQRMLARLSEIEVRVADLPGAYLGLAHPRAIVLDANAAGQGWFVDGTPWLDEEYEPLADGSLRARAASAAASGMDLLTAIAHELGHALGLEDINSLEDPEGLMADVLTLGTRRAPAANDVDSLFGAGDWH